MNKRNIRIQLAIIILGALLFMPGLGKVHLFDWDEINFAESAREMIVSGDYLNVQINFQQFWEKPPLFTWIQVLSMKVFGINEFAARFPNAIMGILTLLVIFNIGRKVRDERFGLIWMLLYIGSFFPFFYFKSGIIDPWFNFFIFLGIWFFTRYVAPKEKKKRMLNAALSAACIGLGILTKGPVALLIFFLTFLIYLAWNKFRLDFRWKDVIVYLLVLTFVGGFWFILQIANGHFNIIQEFIEYQIRLFKTQDAGHGGFLLYHFVILFVGVFPASIIAIPTFRRKILAEESDSGFSDFFRWMMISFWVVLILFTIVTTKIIHYSSFCYFPLTFLAAYQVTRWLDGKSKFRTYTKAILITLSSIFGILLTLVTLFDRLKPLIYPYVADAYTLNSMKATSEWIGFEPAIGIVLIICTVLFCVFFGKRQTMRNFLILIAGSTFYIFTTMIAVVGEVEKYSQGPAIEFYESLKGKDCYTCTEAWSYGRYYYTDRQPENACDDFEFLSQGPITKPCYYVVRNDPETIKNWVSKIDDPQLLYEKAGFVFYVRYPDNEDD